MTIHTTMIKGTRHPLHTKQKGRKHILIYITLRFLRSISSTINRSPADIVEAFRFDPDADEPALEADLKTFTLSGLPAALSALNLTGGLGIGAEGVDVGVGCSIGGVEDDASACESGVEEDCSATIVGAEETSVLVAGGGDGFFPKAKTTFSFSLR